MQQVPPGARQAWAEAPARRATPSKLTPAFGPPEADAAVAGLSSSLRVAAKASRLPIVSAISAAPRWPCRICPSSQRGLVARALSTRATSSAVIGLGWEKSKRRRSAVTSDPFCAT